MAAVRKKVERILNRKAQATENAAKTPVEEPGLDSEAPSIIPALGSGVDPGFGDAWNEADDAAADPTRSYISRLPAELLWEILISRHLSGTADRPWQRQPHNIPIYLTQICSSWRQLALNTPELWSNVSLYFNHQTAPSTGKLINFAATWLSRGRPGGLALEINMGRMYDSDDNRIDKEPIRNLIVSRAGDWQKLAFKNAPNNMARLITSIPDKLFISLEEIEIDVYSSVWDQWCFDTLLSLPLLRRVRFRTWRTSSSIHNFSLLLLPWSQLKELSLSVPVSGEELFSILPACSSMETLDADIFADMPENIASREITLPRLSQLSLSVFPAEEKTLNPFLRALRAPILCDLNLDFVGDVTYRFYRCAFWASHSHQLHKFSPSNLYVHDLCSLLRTMPNLRSLALSPRDILLSARTFDTMRMGALLPSLTRLNVAVGSHAPGVDPMDSVRAAVALVESRFIMRSDSSAPLARFAHVNVVDWTDKTSISERLTTSELLDVEMERLQELKKKGLDIRWQKKGVDLLDRDSR